MVKYFLKQRNIYHLKYLPFLICLKGNIAVKQGNLKIRLLGL